jgi:F-type H+-transporting ATPase subunit b
VINLDLAFVFQLVNFLILVLVLNTFLYKPIRKVLGDRAEQIRGAKAKAVEVDQEVQEKVALYEVRLREIKAKAAEERAAMIKEAQAEEAVLVGKSRAEAAGSLDTIRNRVAKEAAAAREFLKVQAQALSLEICEKVLGRSL